MATQEVVAVVGAMPKPPTGKERYKLYRPYAAAIGRLVLSWNHLQETLSHLFAILMRGPFEALALGAWHTMHSDRAQRDMIQGVIKYTPDEMLSTTQKGDIDWLLGESNKLSDRRNDAIHAPLVFSTDATGTVMKTGTNYHTRARKLAGKDLIREFTAIQKTAEVLRDYASQMYLSIRQPPGQCAWPKRPRLPNLGGRLKPADRFHRIPPK